MMQKIKQAFGVQDMTVGRPMDSLVRFSIPLLLGNLAQQLYNTVDSIVVGKYVGDTALAAVGTAGPILNLLIVLFMGIATGASILSAQYFGAKDREQLSRAVGSTIFLTIASGLVMTVVGYFVSCAAAGRAANSSTHTASAADSSRFPIFIFALPFCQPFARGCLRALNRRPADPFPAIILFSFCRLQSQLMAPKQRGFCPVLCGVV